MSRLAVRGISRNQLLSSLRLADFNILKPELTTVELRLRMVLEEPNKLIRHVYFPLSGIVSVVTASRRRRQIEVGVIGREGMTGLGVLLGDNRSPHSTHVQSAGQAERITVGALRRAIKKSASLQNSLMNYAQTFMIQTAYTALANGQGTVTERLARWLLMAHDRRDGNEITLTHEALALMLSVQRTGVTEKMNLLESRRLISTKRGIIIVRDRAGLKAIANGLYGVPEAEYRRLVGPHAKQI